MKVYRAASGHDDSGFDTFFERGWKRFYLKWYGRLSAVGLDAVSEDRPAAGKNSFRPRGNVHTSVARLAPARAS